MMTLDTKIDIVLKNMNDGQWYSLYDFIEHWLGKDESNLGEDQILIDKMINEGLIKEGTDNKFRITPTGREINERGGWLTTLAKQTVSDFNTLVHKQKKEKQEKRERRIWQVVTTFLTIVVIIITGRQCQQADRTIELELDKKQLINQIDSLKNLVKKKEATENITGIELMRLKNKIDSLSNIEKTK